MILRRLSRLVREQNWFAVGLEVLIVVIGVVIGFQVTAWGQARADRARGLDHLGQLAADLCETERQILTTDSLLGPRDRDHVRLVHAFLLADRPPEDSVFAWLRSAGRLEEYSPVTGAAEALVATGDLRLIPSDSLRTAIVRYLALVDVDTRRTLSVTELWMDQIVAFGSRYDWSEIALRTTPRGVLDSLARVEAFPALPEGRLARPFRFSADDLLSDQAAYANLEQMLNEKRNIASYRHRIRETSEALRADVEAALGDAGGTPSHPCPPAG
ncbi:hypothetical protein [Rubrivirga sp. IMCC43871]|uniref:hypothetical protein n=1 Tax=Rubrivirga sp. IMCC43871 TaxID=3391575 RepID=UPI003990020B